MLKKEASPVVVVTLLSGDAAGLAEWLLFVVLAAREALCTSSSQLPTPEGGRRGAGMEGGIFDVDPLPPKIARKAPSTQESTARRVRK